ncbi:hypothetical protein [Opitutus terrae]|uniref:hypothetical protein n=1 Tax=Opitutus terrae TaxID=107709 RepID=UPI0011D11169|nr:hypothetical protein [Opitutus terrae]
MSASRAGSRPAAEPARTPKPVAPPRLVRVEEAPANEPTDSEPVDVSPNANPEDTNVWPDAAAEEAFLAEAKSRGEPVVRATRTDDDEEEKPAKHPPKLEELVEQIPAETRELMEDLFRARFVAVRRVKRADLKPEEQGR